MPSWPGDQDILLGCKTTASCRQLLNGPWEQYRTPTLTVFLPKLEAVNAFLKAQKLTMSDLLANKTAVNAFVSAHVVTGQRLWIPDLQNLAVVYGSNTPVKGLYSSSKKKPLKMLSGQTLGVATNLTVGLMV